MNPGMTLVYDEDLGRADGHDVTIPSGSSGAPQPLEPGRWMVHCTVNAWIKRTFKGSGDSIGSAASTAATRLLANTVYFFQVTDKQKEEGYDTVIFWGESGGTAYLSRVNMKLSR